MKKLFLCLAEQLFVLVSDAKIRQEMHENKKNHFFFFKLCGQSLLLWTKRRKRVENCLFIAKIHFYFGIIRFHVY